MINSFCQEYQLKKFFIFYTVLFYTDVIFLLHQFVFKSTVTVAI